MKKMINYSKFLENTEAEIEQLCNPLGVKPGQTVNFVPSIAKTGGAPVQGEILTIDNPYLRSDGTPADLSVKMKSEQRPGYLWTNMSTITLIPKAPEAPKEETEIASVESMEEKVPFKPEIEFGDFMKVDTRICKVISAERIPKTDKLIVLTIDTGFDQRTVITNLGGKFEPADFVNKNLPFVLNLKPSIIKKIESKGMIVAIEEPDGTVKLIDSTSPVGSKL